MEVSRHPDRMGRYAADLGIADEIASTAGSFRLGLGDLDARGLKKPMAAELARTYEMALTPLFRPLFVAYAEDQVCPTARMPCTVRGCSSRRCMFWM